MHVFTQRPRALRRLRWSPGKVRAAVLAPVIVALAMGVLLLGAAGQSLLPAQEVVVRQVVFASPDQPREAESSTSAPTRASGRIVQAPGWLEADPYPIACAALAEGVIDTIHALEGERVEAGQVVATLVSKDAELALAVAESALVAAQAELAVAEADLGAAETNWREPVERDRAVAVGRSSVAETRAELDQLPSLIAAEEATLVRMTEELSRARAALASQAANELEVIIFEKRVAAQAATVDALRRRESILAARLDTLEAELDAAERNARLRVAERRALEAGRAAAQAARARVAQLTAQRDEAALRLERMTITAPIAGVVQKRFKAPGDKVMLSMDDPRSAQIALLYDPQKLQVRVDVPLADASQLFSGQQCEVVVEVLPDTTFKGEVTRITHEADLQKNTLQAKVRILDPAPLLRPEMLSRVKFLPRSAVAGQRSGAPGEKAGSEEPVVLAPASVIRGDGDRAELWVVRERRGGYGRAQPVTVSVAPPEAGGGGASSAWRRVRGALAPGDLAIESSASVRAGQLVRYTMAERNVEGGAS